MGNVCFSARREEAVTCSVCKQSRGQGTDSEERNAWSQDGDETVCSNCSAERLQQTSAGCTSDGGSGRSTDTDTFNMSHVVPAAVEARAGPKLGRITPFPLDRTSPKTGTSQAGGRRSTLSAFTEEAE